MRACLYGVCFSNHAVKNNGIFLSTKGKKMNRNRKLISKVGFSMFVTLAVLSLLFVSSMPASGQACAAQNWSASTPNIWAK